MNKLITLAAFIAAIATVIFERLLLPALDITYRYVMAELGATPELAVAGVDPLPTEPVTVTKPARKRRAKPVAVAAF